MEKTPKSRINQALRRLWLRSRERATALKRDEYTCKTCHIKQSQARGKVIRVEVHHKDKPIYWDGIYEVVYRELLINPDGLQTLCKECHKKETKKGSDKDEYMRSLKDVERR